MIGRARERARRIAAVALGPAIAIALALALAPVRAAAQESSAQESAPRVDGGEASREEEARALFERGTSAVRAGRFADARRDLERSIALAPRASTAFNLVVALRGIGAVVEASALCDRLLAGALGEVSPERRAEASPVCRDAAAAIAQLRIAVSDGGPVEIRVDGVSLGRLAPGEELERALDPGRHVVTRIATGGAPADREITLEPGAHATIELGGAAGGAPPEGEADVGLVIGLAAGGAALAIAAAIAIGVAVASSQQGDGADYPVIVTLARF